LTADQIGKKWIVCVNELQKLNSYFLFVNEVWTSSAVCINKLNRP